MRTKRLFSGLVVFACVGFALNIVVVVALSTRVNVLPDPPLGRYLHVGDQKAWAVMRQAFGSRMWELRFDPQDERPSGTPYTAPHWLDPDVPSVAELERSGAYEVTCDARGWPLLAAWCEVVPSPSGAPAHVIGGVRMPMLESWTSWTGDTHPRAVPLRPIWTGVLIDTAFYGLIAYIVFYLIRSQRRLRRFYRGRCPVCGYIMHGQYGQPCPECGTCIAGREP